MIHNNGNPGTSFQFCGLRNPSFVRPLFHSFTSLFDERKMSLSLEQQLKISDVAYTVTCEGGHKLCNQLLSAKAQSNLKNEVRVVLHLSRGGVYTRM